MPSKCPSICVSNTDKLNSSVRLPLIADANSSLSILPEPLVSTSLNARVISESFPFKPRNRHALMNSGHSSSPLLSLSNFLKVSMRSLLICSSVNNSDGSTPTIFIILVKTFPNVACISPCMPSRRVRSSAFRPARSCADMLASSRSDFMAARSPLVSVSKSLRISSCARAPKFIAFDPIKEKTNSFHSTNPDPSTSTLSKVFLISSSLEPRPRNFQASAYSSYAISPVPSLSNAL